MPVGDFSAPSCSAAASVLRSLGSRLGDELRFACRRRAGCVVSRGELKLDIDRYDGDTAGGDHVAHVFEDFNSGTRSGVSGTPTFFVDGARLDWDFRSETLG